MTPHCKRAARSILLEDDAHIQLVWLAPHGRVHLGPTGIDDGGVGHWFSVDGGVGLRNEEHAPAQLGDLGVNDDRKIAVELVGLEEGKVVFITIVGLGTTVLVAVWYSLSVAGSSSCPMPR